MGDPSIIGSLEITILTYAIRCKSTAWSAFATEKSAEDNETVANNCGGNLSTPPVRIKTAKKNLRKKIT